MDNSRLFRPVFGRDSFLRGVSGQHLAAEMDSSGFPQAGAEAVRIAGCSGTSTSVLPFCGP